MNIFKEKKILFIDCLDYFTIIYIFIYKIFCEKIFYIYEINKFKNKKILGFLQKNNIIRLDYSELPEGTGYDEFVSHQNFVKHIFENKIVNTQYYNKVIKYFCFNNNTKKKFDATIKHATMIKLYNEHKCLFNISNKIKIESYKKIIFFTPSLIDYQNIYLNDFFMHNNFFSHFYKFIKEVIFFITRMFFFILNILKLYKMFIIKIIASFREKSIYNNKFQSNKYKFGYVPFSNKFYKNKYYFDTYIYSKDKNSLFYPEKILHIFMNEVIDVETIEFLKLSKIPYTDFNKFKKNKDYFRDLIKINICFFNYIFSNIYKKIIFEEIIQIPYWLQSLKFLNLKYYYINYDQVFPKIASTVMNMLDIKSISAQWCEVSLPMSVNSFYNFDYYGLMGEEYRRVLIKNGSEIENFFVKGNSYSDIIILEEKEGKNFPYSNQKNIYKIVLFVDFFEFSNLFLDAPTYSRVFEKVKIFYATIKELIEKYPDVFIISSLRSEIAYKNLIEFDFMKHIINMNRVILDYKTSIPYLIANSDIIISQHISTTGIEAISSGKSIIYFELSNNKYHIYKKCGIVAYNKEELIEKFDRLYYNRNYYNYESILKKYSNGYSDGKNCERLRKKLELILSE